MKKIVFALFLGIFSISVHAQNPVAQTKPATVIKTQIVDIACGECMFKMKGKSCDLAIKIDGTPYFVDGKSIDDFGDAHAKHGFCNSVRKAEVSGEIVNNRFKATVVKLLPNPKP